MSSTPSQPTPNPLSSSAPPGYELASPKVKLDGVNAKLMGYVEYLALVHRVLFAKPLVITSGIDSLHVPSSLHGRGLAVDFRTRDLDPDEMALVIHILAYSAPANSICYFDERGLPGEAHIHIEYHGE